MAAAIIRGKTVATKSEDLAKRLLKFSKFDEQSANVVLGFRR
jgi:hypothetical protein